MRAGPGIPVAPGTRVDRGDVLRLVGTEPAVERAVKELGYPDRSTAATDMVFVGARIVLGGLVGLLSVTIWSVPLTLTASGGALIMGLGLHFAPSRMRPVAAFPRWVTLCPTPSGTLTAWARSPWH